MSAPTLVSVLYTRPFSLPVVNQLSRSGGGVIALGVVPSLGSIAARRLRIRVWELCYPLSMLVFPFYYTAGVPLLVLLIPRALDYLRTRPERPPPHSSSQLLRSTFRICLCPLE